MLYYFNFRALEDSVSKWQYHIKAIDSGNLSITEVIDISVQQHKGHRSVNHEIALQIKLNNASVYNVDWQILLIESIANVLGEITHQNVVVRDIRQSAEDSNNYLFIFTNETLPKDHCPEVELEEIVEKLYVEDLNNYLFPILSVIAIKEELIGNCKKYTSKHGITVIPAKNFPPVPRNQVDRVNATVGQLLVYRVPSDTFYDPEDENELKLNLLTIERTKLDPLHWLQFDSKNREFFGIPKPSDIGQKEYLLVAEDRGNELSYKTLC